MMDAHRLTLALGGKWRGRYGLAYCPAHENTRTPALSLSMSEDGRLLAYCHAGCDFGSLARAFQRLSLLPSMVGMAQHNPLQIASLREAERREGQRLSLQAQRVWAATVPLRGTVAETYLRDVRRISCSLPDSLRFSRACWHGPSAQRLPAMVGLIQGQAGFAVHRTYLRDDGSGKAALEPAKAMLGRTRGGAVRLSDARGTLAVAEGIESALSLLCGPLAGPVSAWAALSTSGLVGLHLPPKPGRLIVGSDGDVPGQTASHKLAARAAALGWTMILFPAPYGRDWNDVIRTAKDAVK